MNKPLTAATLAPSPAALEMIDRLIAMPTVSRDSNLGLIEFARDHCGSESSRIWVTTPGQQSQSVRHARRYRIA
jgi:hypothetical protein